MLFLKWGKCPVSPVDELMFLLAVGVEVVLDELLAELGVALVLSRHLCGVTAQSIQVLNKRESTIYVSGLRQKKHLP